MNTLRLGQFANMSNANGPGIRSVFWFQGCTLGCVGCINKKWSWASNSPIARDLTPSELAAKVATGVEGITLSGGEPFQQNIATLVEFLGLVSWRGRGDKTVVVFSGYSLIELGKMADSDRDYMRALSMIDILVAGRYDHTRRVQDRALIGSSNQRVHYLTGRYSQRDLEDVAAMEITIDMGTGDSVQSGITT